MEGTRQMRRKSGFRPGAKAKELHWALRRLP